MLIQEDFPTVPRRFIDSTFNQYNHLYATYLALDLAEHTFDTSAPKPYTKLKHKRKSTARALGDSSNMAMSYPTSLTAPEPNGYGITELHRELGAARGQRKKLQTGRQVKADAAAAEAAQEQEHRDNGDVMECQCCFDDTTINKITHCDGPEPHFFCFSCALRNANNEIGLGRHQLLCMDGSGCKAHFSRTERNRFLEPKLLSKLERSEQQAELKNAGLPNLASCPFCDFAAICSPVEVDREFRCYNPDCGRVSCRLCNLDTHIPLSCEEFKKENGLSERHVLEEARSAALIRQCPRCKTATIKEAGCNKVVCTCGGTICDFCGKDITNEGYNHFSDTVRGGRWLEGKKCPTYDDSHMRNEKRIEEAEEKALKKIQEENPNLSKADLEIKFAESVKRPFHGNRWGVPPPPPGGVPMALPPRGMVAQPPMRPNPDPFPNAMVPPPRYPDALNNVVNDREPWAERDEQQMEAEELRALELEYRREALDRLRGRPVLGNDPGQWQQRMDRVIEAQRQRIQRMLDDDQRGIEEEFRRQHERNIRPELPGYPPDIRPPYLNRRRDYNNDHLNLLEGFGEEEFGRPTRRHA